MNIKQRHAQVIEAISLIDSDKFERAVEILRAAKKRGSTVWICGNGGSSATAAHFANDLLKMAHVKAIDISGQTPVTLAFGNDLGWKRMFSAPIQLLADIQDVVVLISCSGTSQNIVEVFEGLTHKCEVITLTGPSNGLLGESTVILNAMAEDITAQEDIHSILCHDIACEIARK